MSPMKRFAFALALPTLYLLSSHALCAKPTPSVNMPATVANRIVLLVRMCKDAVMLYSICSKFPHSIQVTNC